MAASLLKLLDHLQLVAGDFFLVQQIDILDAPVVKNKIVDVVVVNFPGFLNDAVAGFIQPGFHKAQPFAVSKLHVIECLQLHAHISYQGFWIVQSGKVFITLILQILNELTLQIVFALIAFTDLPFLGVLIQNDKIIGFGDGLVIAH